MAGRRKRVINSNQIIELLMESDVEDFIPSDEDIGDPSFDAVSNNFDTETDSDTTSVASLESRSSLEKTSNDQDKNQGRGRGRGRARGVGRGRGRGRKQVRESIQRSNGSSASFSAQPNGSVSSNWVNKDLHGIDYTLSKPSYLPNHTEGFSKINFFEQYLDSSFVTLIVEFTNRMSIARHGRSVNIDEHEFYVYLGITLIMSAINYPWIRMYWEAKWRVPIIADNMPRNRFVLLRNSLKVVYDGDVGEDVKKADKLWKMRPLIKVIQQGCRMQEKDQRLSLDEMMIPFTGSCGIRQYCPGKPNSVGLKAFVLANPNGLVVDFDIYQGNTTYPDLETSGFGLGDKAVLSLVDSLVPGHIIYFDRYFTSIKLAKELTKKGIGCTGTIKSNRIPADARSVLIEDKLLKKRGRGSIDSVVNEEYKFAIIKWYDNKPVTLLSTVECKEPMDVCQRWCKSTRQYVSVNRPAAIRNYNKYMGGVDQADRMLSVCPNRYRTKKWTQRFFSHMVDLAISNSWIIFKQQEIKRGVPAKKVQQLRQFKLELGETFIEMHAMEETQFLELETEVMPLKRFVGKPASTPTPSKIMRTTGAKHLPSFEEKQARCRQCHYNMSRTKCTTCNLHLCLTKNRNCYVLFHQK